MSVSIHVVDCVYGKPAVGMSARLSRDCDGVLIEQWHDQTDDEGSISGLQKPPLDRGHYSLEFDLDGYFRPLGYAPLHSAVSLRFHLASQTSHYGLSLLITPSSCLTFRED